MEFFVMADETNLIKIKQKLNEKNISYKIKTVNNTIRIPIQLNGLFCRNKKNYYTISVKEEYAERAKEIMEKYKK